MKCVNHPDLEAQSSCVLCKRPFCIDCVTEIAGKNYCSECKLKIVDTLGQPKTVCKEATSSLVKAIIGFFVFGWILGPMAISSANKAKKLIAEDPNLTGAGRAQAGFIIGIFDIVLWVLGLLLLFI